MKKIITGTIRSVIITIANLCFLCGAGYMVDWTVQAYTDSKKRMHKYWQAFINSFGELKTATYKRRYTK